MNIRPAHVWSALAAVTVCLALLGLPTPATAASTPVAPSAVAASFGGAGLLVTWADNSSDESGFSIERCIGGNCTNFGQVATVGAGVTSFTDLYNTSTGSYRVRAYNSAGFSQYSGSAEIVLVSSGDAAARMTAAPLSGPAPLTVTFDGSASTALNGTLSSWQWSFGDNQTAAGVTAGHTYTAPGVYAASLKVTTSGGFGSATGTTAVIITVTAPPLVAPSDLTATSPARGQIRLSWSNPVSSTTALTLERCKGAKCTSFTRIAVLTTTATSYLDTKASPGTTYKYRLAASESTATAYSNTAVATALR
jgi:PKD repeat protein